MTNFPLLCRLSPTVAFVHHPYFDLFSNHRKSLELLRNLPKSHWANARLKSNPNTSSLSTCSTSRPKLILHVLSPPIQCSSWPPAQITFASTGPSTPPGNPRSPAGPRVIGTFKRKLPSLHECVLHRKSATSARPIRCQPRHSPHLALACYRLKMPAHWPAQHSYGYPRHLAAAIMRRRPAPPLGLLRPPVLP
jgi:hypothetical protein